MTPTIIVPPDLAAFTDKLFERKMARLSSSAAHRNNLKRDRENDRLINRTGMRGEAGLFAYFGGDKGGATWDTRYQPNTPDIIFGGYKYDAKGIDRNHLALCIYPEGLHRDWRYALVGVEHWPEVELLGWCDGLDIDDDDLIEKVKGRPAYFIEQGDPRLRSWVVLFVIQDRDGDYIERVESGDTDTVPIIFRWTKDVHKARRFTNEELYSRGDPLMMRVIRGHAGASAIEYKDTRVQLPTRLRGCGALQTGNYSGSMSP